MRERRDQPNPNVFKKAGVAFAAVGAMLGATSCSAIHAFDENYMPKCDPAVETVSLDKAREAYANPKATISYYGGEPKNPNREFAEDLDEMDCWLNGKQVVIRSLAEENGAIFEPTPTTTKG
ncbi:MAG: hypothetical protein WAS94_01210 [Candidatus Saccharimonadales bacterium]